MSTLTGDASGRRDRFTRTIRAGLVPQQRDGVMLTDMFLHGMLSRGQIQELYFGRRPQTATARLRLLFDHGYVLRSFPEEAPYGAQACYSMAARAVPLIAERLNLTERQVRERMRKSPTPLFRAHALAVVDFRLALLRHARELGAEIVEWAPEMTCRHEYTLRRKGGGDVRREVFRPDGYFRLRLGRVVFDGFLEMDLGHTGRKPFLEKITSFTVFVASGLYRSTYGDAAGGPALLVQTTGERRLSHLAEIATPWRGPDSPDVRFATAADATAHGLLAPIWRTAQGRRTGLLPPERGPPSELPRSRRTRRRMDALSSPLKGENHGAEGTGRSVCRFRRRRFEQRRDHGPHPAVGCDRRRARGRHADRIEGGGGHVSTKPAAMD